MALVYFHGKWLHDRANIDRDPIAIMVKRLWSAEYERSYQQKRREVVSIIGRARWNVLYGTKRTVGKEAFYRAVYDAIFAAGTAYESAELPAL